MKRAKFLWPLTQGHHRGLVAARNIKDRIARMEGAEGPQLEALRSEVVEFWVSELQGHFAAEEEVLRLLGAHVGPEDGDVARILSEHRKMEQAIQRGTKEELLGFADLLKDHIRFEEDHLFARLERELTPEEIRREEGFLLREAVPACIHLPAAPQSSKETT